MTMTYKWIGALLVILGSSGFGFCMGSHHRKTEKQLRQFLQILEDMTCLLQYKIMPLPDLCRNSVHRINGPLRALMLQFAGELEKQVAPDAPSCMSAALAYCPNLGGSLRYLASELGHSLGIYDLPGQLQGLKSAQENCQRVLKNMECNRELRIRSYQTLGICTGTALAILFI